MAADLFDASFYRATNSDLASFSNEQALSHFQNYGLNEGRAFSPLINLNFYRSSNYELSNLNNHQAFKHLQSYGMSEGRRFSQFADLNFYRSSNADLANLDNKQAFVHLQNYGVNEGRTFSQFFDINYYRNNNLDLADAGFNQGQLLKHFQLSGLDEERRFSVAFDINYYRSINSDLASAGLNSQQLYEHFQLYGLAEGRASSQFFNISSYRDSKPELANLNNSQVYEHFIIYKQQERSISNDPNTTTTSPSFSSFDIHFDYRFDTNGFFNNPAHRVVLEAAADVWKNIIKDDFTNVPIETNLYISNPQTNAPVRFVSDYEIDDLVVFVGAMSIDSSGRTLAEGGPSATYYTDSNLDTRFNSFNNFEPWTGSISFDSSDSWFFDTTPNTSNDIPVRSIDFLSVAVHELGHVLGIGSSNAFDSLIFGGFFYGSNAKALNGNNPIPLDYGLGHVEDGLLIGGVEAVMDPSTTFGIRKLPTPLDIAFLADIGYQV